MLQVMEVMKADCLSRLSQYRTVQQYLRQLHEVVVAHGHGLAADNEMLLQQLRREVAMEPQPEPPSDAGFSGSGEWDPEALHVSESSAEYATAVSGLMSDIVDVLAKLAAPDAWEDAGQRARQQLQAVAVVAHPTYSPSTEGMPLPRFLGRAPRRGAVMPAGLGAAPDQPPALSAERRWPAPELLGTAPGPLPTLAAGPQSAPEFRGALLPALAARGAGTAVPEPQAAPQILARLEPAPEFQASWEDHCTWC